MILFGTLRISRKMEKFLTGIVALLLIKVCVGLRAFTPDNQYMPFPLARKGLTITNITQLSFKLKACFDGHVFIQEDKVADLFSDGHWAFGIGTNQNSRSDFTEAPFYGGNKHYFHHIAPLDCNEFRPFWISWKGGLLELGEGSEFGIDRISFHNITPMDFNYVFLMTGWGSDGCWDIDSASAVLASGWTKVPGNRKLQGLKVKSSHARGPLECADRCATPTEDLPCGCMEYSYNKLTKQCLVVDGSEDSTIVTATGWRTWQLV